MRGPRGASPQVAAAAALCGRGAGALRALPWLSGRVSGQRRVAGRLGERCGPKQGGRDEKFWVERVLGGAGSRPSGRRARESPFLLSGTPPSVCVCVGCLPGVWILSREPSQDPATVGGEPAQGPVGAPGSGVGWHRAPDRRGPRGPLFPLHVARFSCQARGEGGGRREGAAALTCRR